jgi:hypothetical protein
MKERKSNFLAIIIEKSGEMIRNVSQQSILQYAVNRDSPIFFWNIIEFSIFDDSIIESIVSLA